jgi:hypothetical protein
LLRRMSPELALNEHALASHRMSAFGGEADIAN